MKILVVDDDLELLGLIAYALRQAGYVVVEAADGPTAYRLYAEERPDLAIVDVNLPGMDGLELVRRIRAAGSRTPVMMLTVRSAEEDQVAALDLGADDYMSKPFSPRTLMARVRALLRRAGHERPSGTEVGDLQIEPEAHTVSVGGNRPVTLTRLEFRLLQMLAANAGHTVAADRLTSHVWGYRGLGDRQMLKQLVRRLRLKLESDAANPRYIVTEAGTGYRLDPSPEDS